MATYTFGDDDPAVRRLGLIADAYAPVSEAFVTAHARPQCTTVLDLGCGPGFTTELLARVLAPTHLVGADASVAFLDVARRRVPGARFVRHDATALPLPAAPVDVLYARLLLAHLPDPLGTVDRWRGALAPGGVLLIEDLEDVEAPAGPLRAYEDLSAAVVRTGGGLLYGGAAIARHGGRCVPVTVPAATAATVYLVNVDRWLADGASGRPRHRLEGLRDGLAAVARHGGGTVSWIVRQVALDATTTGAAAGT